MRLDRRNLFVIAGFVSTAYIYCNSSGLSDVFRYNRVLRYSGLPLYIKSVGRILLIYVAKSVTKLRQLVYRTGKLVSQ